MRNPALNLLGAVEVDDLNEPDGARQRHLLLGEHVKQLAAHEAMRHSGSQAAQRGRACQVLQGVNNQVLIRDRWDALLTAQAGWVGWLNPVQERC